MNDLKVTTATAIDGIKNRTVANAIFDPNRNTLSIGFADGESMIVHALASGSMVIVLSPEIEKPV